MMIITVAATAMILTITIDYITRYYSDIDYYRLILFSHYFFFSTCLLATTRTTDSAIGLSK